jgi:uroporphyrinogen III methyltransferase / synthase
VNELSGRVFLVGAGPGAADLISLRGAALVQEAEVVVYDYLVNPEIVRMAPRNAQRIYVGKKGGSEHKTDQNEINRLLIAYARRGRRVVRLKGGDPFIFARGGEEAEALAGAGIDYEVVPGITSAIAVPAFAGIPLTHRDYGSFVTFVPGHGDTNKNPAAALPWSDLARAANHGGTLVILMATVQMRENLARLAAGGLSAATPAVAIRWGTTAAQTTITATLATLADEVEGQKLTAPVVVVIGECARLGQSLHWFDKMPLSGRRIIVTRAATTADEFAWRLRMLGAEAITFPTIEMVPPDDYRALDQAIGRLRSFDWVIFTSARGVEAFVERLRLRLLDIRELGDASLAAIGPATAERLRHYGLTVAAMPSEYRAEGIVSAIGTERIVNARILIPRAQVAREVLPQSLLETGAREVLVAPVYKTIKPADADTNRIRALLADHAIDLVTFTSSSTVTNFCELLGGVTGGLRAAAIGPITAETARRHGFDLVISAAKYTVDELLASIVSHFRPPAHH